MINVRPNVLITNTGEHPTTISKIVVYAIALRTETEQGQSLYELKTPIRIEGKDTIVFKEEIPIIGLIPEEDCKLQLTIYFVGGIKKSNSVVSKYHKILPPPFTEFKKPKD